MRNTNTVVIHGRMTKDPELRKVSGANGDTANVSITVAVNRPQNKNGESVADFIPVQAWGKTAEAVVNYCKKGSEVVVTGPLRVNNYRKKNPDGSEGDYMSFTYVQADLIEFIGNKKPVEAEESVDLNPETDSNPF